MLYIKYILLKLLLGSVCINGGLAAIRIDVLHSGNCVSKIQSPININTSSVIPVNFAPLQPKYFDEAATSFTLINTGYTLDVTVVQTNNPQISGGPLRDSYTFSRAHYHWGENDTVGSEHTIDYQRYPMELYLVFFNNKYGGNMSAIQHGDGTVILTFFYKISSDDNAVYTKYFNLLSKIQKAGTSANISNPDSLMKLISNPNKYYVYKGTLTVPSYSQIVSWIVFENPINVSSKQMALLRTLKDKNGKPITHNYRNLQPLNYRNVYTNSDGSVVSPGLF